MEKDTFGLCFPPTGASNIYILNIKTKKKKLEKLEFDLCDLFKITV